MSQAGTAGGGGAIVTPVTVPNGGTGVISLTNHAVVIGQGVAALVTAGPGVAGQVLTSNGALADPTYQAAPSGFVWQAVAVGGALASGNGYICTAPAGALSFALPAVAAVGETYEISLDGATSWTVTQGAGQQIRISSLQTTAGVAGSIASTAQGDSVKIVCSVANTRFNVVSLVGNINVT